MKWIAVFAIGILVIMVAFLSWLFYIASRRFDVGNEKVLKDAVIRWLQTKKKTDPGWTLYLGKESLTAEQLLIKINKDKKFWKEIRNWADALAVDMFNEGSRKIESNSS